MTDAPLLPLLHLDCLWLQVMGTVCNIACRHCFISCGPKVHIHAPMSVAQVRQAIEEAEALGCRATAFTGGEPFLHPDILELVDIALARGPLEILSNGMCIDAAMASALALRARNSPYSLELRISLDGLDAAENDAIRGPGVFDACLAGIRCLVQAGLEPVLAVTTVHEAHASAEGRAAFYALLRELGVSRPRLKLIPPFRIGREARRAGPYQDWEQIRGDMLDAEAPWLLQCGTSRMVTARGAWPCPILVNIDAARLGDGLAQALRPVALDQRACHTCLVEGFSCRT